MGRFGAGGLYFHFEDLFHDGGHVVVFVFGQSSAKDDILLCFAQLAIFFGQAVVLFVVDGVVGFFAFLPCGGKLARDDRLRVVVHFVAKHFKVLVLDDAGVWYVGFGIVDHGVALEIGLRQRLLLETDGAVFETAVAEVEVLVYLSCEDNLLGQTFPVAAVGKEVGVQSGLNAVEQSVNEFVVAANGYALEGVVEVVVVEHEPHGQTLDDERRQLGAFPPPLFLGVAFDESLVDVFSHEQQGLLFEVGGLGLALLVEPLEHFAALLLNLAAGFVGCQHAPHLVEGVHVERQIVEAPLVVGHRRIDVMVEGYDVVDKIPHLGIGCVEDVGTVFVYVDARYVLTIEVSAQMRPLVNDQASLACLAGLVGKDAAEESGTDNEEIVLFHGLAV